MALTRSTSLAPQPDKIQDILAASFFALLFFLGSADLFFATRIAGFNFRWGQLLLLIAAIPAYYSLLNQIRENSDPGKTKVKFFLHWVPFFLIYGLAALCSATPLLTGIKWGWGLFNIGLAALVCLQPRRNESLARGFEWGILAIASLLWIQALAIYAFPSFTQVADQGEANPSTVSFFSLFLGYAQPSFAYQGLSTFRPHAFYYEPSYVGAALSFALALLLSRALSEKAALRGILPALALSSILLCSSRTGILSAVLFLFTSYFLSRWNSGSPVLRRTLIRTVLISILMVGAFCLFPMGRQYVAFVSGPLGADSYMRLHKKNSSEQGRLENMQESLQRWSEHPLLGNGVTKINPADQGLSQLSIVTWFEIGLESGVLGVAAFLYAILANMRLAWNGAPPGPIRSLVLSAWLVHFGFQLFFSQTFPRLDYWLLFFLSIRLLLDSGGGEKSKISPQELRSHSISA